MKQALCAVAAIFLAVNAYAASGDLVTLPSRDGVTQSIYVQSPSDNPPWVVVLFGGSEGALHLAADGATTLKGNFLIRTAGFWVNKGDAAVLVDTPSDNADGVDDSFRLGKDSFTDTATIVRALRQRFPSSKIALVGTSRGTVSVGNAIERDPGVADAFVLTSPVSIARRRNAGLSGMHVDGTKYRVLVVSNQHDACPASPLYGGKRLAERNHFDFIAVDSTEGGGSAQADCGGHSPHGFLGIEDEALADINGWLTGHPVAAQ
jgi:pimeloyl-ACP methyl ester carboxylesterase